MFLWLFQKCPIPEKYLSIINVKNFDDLIDQFSTEFNDSYEEAVNKVIQIYNTPEWKDLKSKHLRVEAKKSLKKF